MYFAEIYQLAGTVGGQMRGSSDDDAAIASRRERQFNGQRRRLSHEEEAWIARQLEKAPPLGEPARRRIEQLLALPPDRIDVVGIEVRAS